MWVRITNLPLGQDWRTRDTGSFREPSESPRRGKMLPENSFKSLKLPVRWNLSVLVYHWATGYPLWWGSCVIQGALEKCQWASFSKSYPCPGVDSLLKTKTLGGTWEEKNRKQRKGEKRREEDKDVSRRRCRNNRTFCCQKWNPFPLQPTSICSFKYHCIPGSKSLLNSGRFLQVFSIMNVLIWGSADVRS